MVGIGIVGVGFMGMIHYLGSKGLKGGRVSAICTRDEKKLAGDWTSIKGNFGPAGKQEDLTGINKHRDLKDLLKDPAVDLVDVCLPNQFHAETVITALEAGKHVLVEKAIALTLADADRMVAAAKKNNRMLMVAHVLPFFPDFGFVKDLADSKKYGKIKAAHFRRHIAPPDWSAAMKDFSTTGGGPIVDLHVHDTHFVRLLFGRPLAVQSRGSFHGPICEYVSTQYVFDDPTLAVSATSGAISQASRPFTHGYEVYFERATVYYEAGYPLTVYTAAGVEHPTLPGSGDPVDSFTAELQTAIDAVVAGKPAPTLDGALARDALALCLLEEQSAKTGQPVNVT